MPVLNSIGLPQPLPPGARGVDTVLFRSPDVRIGAFRCPLGHPEFQTAGPIEGYSVVFPRSAVWIQHSGGRPFVADPAVAAIYNHGQPYRRFQLSTEGDRADWFSVSARLASALVTEIGVGGALGDPARPFPIATGPVPAPLYYRQRLLFARVSSGRLRDADAIEREVVELLREILRLALTERGQVTARASLKQRQLAEQARAELAADPAGRSSVRELAARVGVSPFHLCRLFRRHTGHTLHQYRLELRARLALERLETSGRSLSRVAHGIGYSSHSHFTAEFRQRLGLTPSGARRLLRWSRSELG